MNKLIKPDRFFEFDESDIIDSATTGHSFIRRMNENSFNFSFSIRLNVPKKFEFTKTPCGEISESLVAQTNIIIEQPLKIIYLLIDIVLIEESFIHAMSSIIAIAK